MITILTSAAPNNTWHRVFCKVGARTKGPVLVFESMMQAQAACIEHKCHWCLTCRDPKRP